MAKKCNSLEEFIKYLQTEIINNEYERPLRMSFDEDSILIFIFENEVPIQVKKHKVYYYENSETLYNIETFAELYTELYRNSSISKVELDKIIEVIDAIEENIEIFEKILK